MTHQTLLETVALSQINAYNKAIFMSGGISLPEFKTYADYVKFIEMAKELFPSSSTPFNAYQDPGV